MRFTYATGRRKTSVAKVFMFIKGKGAIQINKKSFETYFPMDKDRHTVLKPLVLLMQEKNYDFHITVYGGGVTSQTEAIQLGISRALASENPENRPLLKKESLLRRDPRMVQSKRYGFKKARKKPQFSKR